MRSQSSIIFRTLRRLSHNPIWGGTLLIIAAAIALVWANMYPEGYHHFWHDTILRIGRGKGEISEINGHMLINDLLMAIFFFFTGLEIKREVKAGELSTFKQAVLPLVAAVGGMVVPALIYLYFNQGLPTADGWGIPMATDIAFSLGVLGLLGTRAPLSLKIFLTALAIGDDLGAVIVIALFYSDHIIISELAWGAGGLGLLLVANLIGIRNHRFYYLIGLVVVWSSFLVSGVHATLAGVLVAFTFPASPKLDPDEFVDEVEGVLGRIKESRFEIRAGVLPAGLMKNIVRIGRKSFEAANPLQLEETVLDPYVTFFIMPLFALANAGVPITGEWSDMISNPAALGVALGLLLGKPIGIFLFTYGLHLTKLGRIPPDVSLRHLLGVGFLAGIGFTMSLFITNLAFVDETLRDQVKLAIIVASLISGIIGFALLFTAKPKISRSNI
ncbi:MAG: Na+/H+ antiporter NhaA [Bacteroidota bacterium]|nr:Na+/H+ antiporter NhaA [Bacteroidota bacterium]